jgi:hypothetical protein
VFILDRFHASSMSSDLMLPLFCGGVSRDDAVALGEVAYQLAREWHVKSSLNATY